MGIVENISSVYSEWVDVYKTNAKALLLDIAKLELLSFFVSLVGVGIMLLLTIALFSGSTLIPAIIKGGQSAPAAYTTALATITQNLLLFLVLMVPIIIILVIVTKVLSSVSLNIIANRLQGKDTNILEHFSANFVPVTLYELLIGVIFLSVLSPVLIAAMFGGLAAVITLCVVLILLFLILIFFSFFTQFAFFELVIGRLGVIDSIKRSFVLVRENAALVLVFDIVLFFTSLVIGTPLAVIDMFVRLMGNVLMSFGGIVGILLYLFVYSIFGLISGIIGTFFMTTLFYIFWRNLSGSKQPDKVIKVSAQIEMPKEFIAPEEKALPKAKAKKTT